MMMRPKAVTVYLPFVEMVADDFIQRLKKVRVESKLIPNLRNEISKWNVKCKCCVEGSLLCLLSENTLKPLEKNHTFQPLYNYL